MTIQLDLTASTNGTASTTASLTHTISAGAKNVAVFTHITGVGSTSIVPTPTYAGNAMTLLDNQEFDDLGNPEQQYVYYALGMPSGDNTVTVEYTIAPSNWTISVLGYTGVDQTAPIGTQGKQTVSTAITTNTEITVTSSTNGLVIDFLSVKDTVAQYTPGSGQTERLFVASGGTGTNRQTSQASEKLGATSVTMTWSNFSGLAAGAIAIPLLPAQSLITRGVDYFFDIYEPLGKILDASGQEVPPWEMRANRWIRVSGLFLPSSTKYDNFTQDPELAYIEEVSFSSRGGLRIKTNRGELTEVLLARAAGGKTL